MKVFRCVMKLEVLKL